MTDAPLAAVCNLLIVDQGVPETKVTPDARLLHDLGVDGDDAGEVFQALRRQFGTGFSELDRQWCSFFNTEGISLQATMVAIVAIIVLAGGAGVLVAALHWPKFLAWAVPLTLFMGSAWFHRRWLGQDLRAVTVSGLAEVVRAGRWPTNPADVR